MARTGLIWMLLLHAAFWWATRIPQILAETPAVPSRAAVAPSEDPDSGAELIGRPAPAWSFTRWVRGPDRALEDFRGKVVLVRWWTDGCRFCRSTLPVLEALQRRHPDDLVVVGVYHPKPPRDVSNRRILGFERTLGFSGPVALDRDWKTLERWWLDADPRRNWTSVSFLVDKDGLLRWVHGGGEYHPSTESAHHRCDVDYRGLEAALATALERPAHVP
jgi:thiol-disulfide isomerase/thioredoxin